MKFLVPLLTLAATLTAPADFVVEVIADFPGDYVERKKPGEKAAR